MGHRPFLRAAIGAGLSLALFAAAPALPARADDAPVAIAIQGGKFVPDEVTVPAGRKIRLVIRNRDATMSEFESTDLHREKTVPPGGQITVFVGPLDPGRYEFFDDFHPSDRGHLVVK